MTDDRSSEPPQRTCRNVQIRQADWWLNLWDVTYECGAVERVNMRASNRAIPENDRKHRCAEPHDDGAQRPDAS